LKITDKRVLPDFARDIFAGRDITMHSDGSPTRTFCYIADAIVGYYKILVKGKPGEAYNIGVEKPEISMADLVKGDSIARRPIWLQGTSSVSCQCRGRLSDR
jgi:UDP-glucuronate decarboxylase